jgi:predicted DNA-binding transcriptional regulator AlpA
MIMVIIKMRRYSSAKVARMLGLHPPNLSRLIRQKRIPFPPLVRVGGVKVRLWSDADVERARKAMKRK